MKSEVLLPDIGDFEDVEVVEILVAAGDRVRAEDSLVTVESDKATLEIPSPRAGTVIELYVALGDRVSEGSRILALESDAADEAEGTDASGPAQPGTAQPAAPPAASGRRETAPAETARTDGATARAGVDPSPAEAEAAAGAGPSRDAAERPAAAGPDRPRAAPAADSPGRQASHASPSVRRLARELGVDLARVEGSGRKGRILKSDVQDHVKRALAGGPVAAPGNVVQVEPRPEIDFARFGEVEVQEMHRIRRISAKRLHAAWVTVPHVTQFDEADVTELEEFRRERREEAERRGVKPTLLPFLIKAAVGALRELPRFNASLDASGEKLVLKRYFHLGIAVDTPHGLIVPVIRDADAKSLFDLAAELADKSERARSRRLRPDELAGGSFSISSLGGVGGTHFTPIVNPPEVAILGVSRHAWKPVWRDGEFVPRLTLPLSLSYDHRVIDGVEGARFTAALRERLSDVRNLLI